MKVLRRPIGNFFIAKRVQKRFLGLVLGSALFGLLLASGILCAYVYANYGEGYFFFLREQGEPRVERFAWETLLLPLLVSQSLVTLGVYAALGLYASRRIALPLFKIRRWAQAVVDGDFAHRIALRRRDDLQELSDACNRVSGHVGEILDRQRRILEDESLEPRARLEKLRTYLLSIQK